MMLELEVRHPGDNEFMEKSNLLEKKRSNQWVVEMEVSEGFQVYCREGATHWREFKKLIDRREN